MVQFGKMSLKISYTSFLGLCLLYCVSVYIEAWQVHKSSDVFSPHKKAIKGTDKIEFYVGYPGDNEE